jgi:hypothetical protein
VYAFLASPVDSVCSAHLMLLNLVTPIILGDDYKLWRSSLCNFLHPPVIFSPLVRNIPLKNPFSNTSAYVFPFVSETKYCTRTDLQGNKDMYRPVLKCWLKASFKNLTCKT